MSGLKYIMRQAVHLDLRLLRGKTIKCISLMVLAVSKERFLQDAKRARNRLETLVATRNNLPAMILRLATVVFCLFISCIPKAF